MVVAENQWQSLETGLKSVLDARLPAWRSMDDFEVHGADLRRGKGPFADMTVDDRIAFRDAWMEVGRQHNIRLMSRSIHKKRFAEWLNQAYGEGIRVNPHVVAFAFLSRCIDNYLQTLPEQPLGIFISDENKEIVADIEKSINVLRELKGTLRLSRIVEKGFFIDSCKSLPLQLCDLFAMSLRKQSERDWACGPPKAFDDSGIARSQALLYTDNQHLNDTMRWLTTPHADFIKKQRPGDKPRVG
jgi:hypothetical protein